MIQGKEPYITTILLDKFPEKGYHSWRTLHRVVDPWRHLRRNQILIPSMSYPIGVIFNHLGGPKTDYRVSVDDQNLTISALQGYHICGTAMAGEKLTLDTPSGIGSYNLIVCLEKDEEILDTVQIAYDVGLGGK